MRIFLLSVIYFALIQGAYSQYFPPNSPRGNVININYYDSKLKPQRYFQSLSVDYKFNILSSSPVGTRFIATQFWLDPRDGSGNGDTLYMGINPPQKAEGYSGQAHFSYFGSHAGKLYSKNCAKGADGGSGVTCGITLSAQEKHKYRLTSTIKEVTAQHTVVQGTLVEWDEKGRRIQSTIIGEFEILRGHMGYSYPVGWVEGSSDPCSALVKTEIAFSSISVKNFDAKYGKYDLPIKTIPSNKCGVTMSAYPKKNIWIMRYGQ
ncbi:hypothetical protein [Brucella pseudintermedia]|uniref:hypothetical protein n=1 Tax=Brucella pseudintermedia TaxID=370111 RepID=UPI0013CE8DEC